MRKEERRKEMMGGEEKTKEKVERKMQVTFNNIMELNFRC